MVAQCLNVELLEAEMQANPGTIPTTRLTQLKTATGASRLSRFLSEFPWADARTFFTDAPCHMFLLGLWRDTYKCYQETLGVAGFKGLKLDDERQQFLLVPSEYKRGVKTIYPKNTTLSGYRALLYIPRHGPADKDLTF